MRFVNLFLPVIFLVAFLLDFNLSTQFGLVMKNAASCPNSHRVGAVFSKTKARLSVEDGPVELHFFHDLLTRT